MYRVVSFRTARIVSQSVLQPRRGANCIFNCAATTSRSRLRFLSTSVDKHQLSDIAKNPADDASSSSESIPARASTSTPTLTPSLDDVGSTEVGAVSNSAPTQAAPSADRFSKTWLHDLRARVNNILREELPTEDYKEIRAIKKRLSSEWAQLLAGREGFLINSAWGLLNTHPVAWGDMHGHVNNVMYNKWAEFSRVSLIHRLEDLSEEPHKDKWLITLTPKEVGLIMKSIKTEFKFPVEYPDSVQIIHRLTKKPLPDSTSLHFEVAMYSSSHKRLVARCWEEVVVYDYAQRKKSTLHDFMIAQLQGMYEQQGVCKKRTEGIVASFFRRVEHYEKSVTERKQKAADAERGTDQ